MNGSRKAVVFHDGKDPGALRTIGEVARALGIRQHVLRYWEEQFPALQPVKRSGGRRYYRPEDVALIAEIDRLLHREGYTLRGACKALSERSTGPHGASGADEPGSGVGGIADDDVRRQLLDIRKQLAEALAAA
ncbi:MerR family transcriptional regulator [Novosphingobium mangrovi (ex Huang et al. 2023)]|uniref:MerR family transcriptional regulator n=1 Tax=Novosphingobium mangrovi (ex Huang et al. 2023) TaxID=2976432 RepID=A0ABT2I3S4_9SPHN|nr:MerR family transcriptional regulator [Novosphingobium mangrovi (ex Huang et al. 2023)]MCT2399459.1 MerR family transcriptional regulator [Novosphingobium mangrovi (ex Huang et al. 2023)]